MELAKYYINNMNWLVSVFLEKLSVKDFPKDKSDWQARKAMTVCTRENNNIV